jgi:GT2 family glycosyltransferase
MAGLENLAERIRELNSFMESSSPLVVTVILNTNRKEDTLTALQSLSENNYPVQRVIVLDNASKDGSIPAIHHRFPDAQVIELEQNLGYAGNNNVGIQAALDAGADWVLVLNEDTILAPDCITRLVEVGEREVQTGIVGPMVYHHNEPSVIQSAGGEMNATWDAWHIAQNEVDHGEYREPHAVDWISGCAIMVRRTVIEQVGMLDERFFYYWEETEWCLRARRAGWKILHVPQAHLWHKGVQRDYRPGPNVTYYSTRNRLLILSKHHAPVQVQLSTWFELLRRLISWTVKPKWREMRLHRDALWQGMGDFLRKRWGMRPS